LTDKTTTACWQFLSEDGEWLDAPVGEVQWLMCGFAHQTAPAIPSPEDILDAAAHLTAQVAAQGYSPDSLYWIARQCDSDPREFTIYCMALSPGTDPRDVTVEWVYPEPEGGGIVGEVPQ